MPASTMILQVQRFLQLARALSLSGTVVRLSQARTAAHVVVVGGGFRRCHLRKISVPGKLASQRHPGNSGKPAVVNVIPPLCRHTC